MEPPVLRIDPAVDIIPTRDGTITFRTPQGDFSVTDPFGMVHRVTEQCRQGVTNDILEAGCAGREETDQMHRLVETLRRRRVLTDSPARDRRDNLTEWLRHHAGQQSAELPTVALTGHGQLADALRQKLVWSGFRFGAVDNAEACLVAVSDGPDMTWLLQQNQQALDAHRPFLPAWLDRSVIHWGPMVLPGATGCLACWWHRRSATARKAQLTCDSPSSSSSIVADVAAGLVSAELLRWGLNAHVTTEFGMGWRFDLTTSDMDGSLVLQLPRCPSCGAGA